MNIRILLIEDQIVNARLVEAMIASLNSDQSERVYSIKHAGNMRDGMNLLNYEVFDLILLDLTLPDSEGINTFFHMRQSYPGLPIVVLTGQDDETTATETVKNGAQDYLVKGHVDSYWLDRSIRYSIQRKQIEDALRASEERYALAAQGSQDGLWDWSLEENELYLSDRWKEMIGYESGEISNNIESWFDRVHHEDIDKLKEALNQHIQSDYPLAVEYRIQHKDGSFLWMLCRGAAVRYDDGKAYRIAGSQTDITTLRAYDPLTGLPNRFVLQERITTAVERKNREPGYGFALIQINLQRFTVINESLGHSVGDRILRLFSSRLEECIRSEDMLARIGGDEFAIFLDNILLETQLQQISGNILQAVSSPFRIGERELLLNVSGGAVIAEDNLSPVQILQNLTTALLGAKKRGGNYIELFDPENGTTADDELRITSDLRAAINSNRLEIYYQPQLDIQSGGIVGAEALIRWHHHSMGFIRPDRFVYLAEQTGLIHPLGDWIFQRVCQEIHDLIVSDIKTVPIAINLSPLQFQQGDLGQKISSYLNKFNLSPAHIELEITESKAMDNLDRTIETLRKLEATGFSIAIDDFGTGYSSLSYLKRFPIKKLKIDRSFVSELPENQDDIAMIKAMIGMAKGLRLKTIAEGVETEEQLNLLKENNCDYLQGYYYSKPLPYQEFKTFLATSRNLASTLSH